MKAPTFLFPLLAFGLITAAAGCDEPLAGAPTPAPSLDPIPALTQSKPATPVPQVVATPRREPTPEVATPAPATPVPHVTPTPPPVTPGPSTSPSGSAGPSASPGASATPSADPSASPSPGSVKTTGIPGDLALSGPGYFVLATKATPAGTEDLLFTRHGRFGMKSEQGVTPPVFRLRHLDHGFPVVGFARAGGIEAGAPAETSGPAGAVLATTWGDGPATALGLGVDADRNPEALSKTSFDYTGRLLVAGAAPRGADASPAQAYVAIAQFADPKGLTAAPGIAGVFRYAPAAGAMTLGVAVTGPGRAVGNANLVLTGKLEAP